MTVDITLGLAFVAGLASFFSPCVFPLIPAYVSYLSGRSAGETDVTRNRWVTFTHGLAFVLGFSLVFITLGVFASMLGGFLIRLSDLVSRAGGIIVIFLGLHMTGILRIPFLEQDTRATTAPDPKWGYLSSALLGIVFSAGWTPCTGPVLGAITMLVMNGGSIAKGIILFSVYSAGLGIPFLAAALGIGWVTLILRKYGRAMRIIEIAMGVILIVLGVFLMFGQLAWLSKFGIGYDFGL
jgi:cytochrome c-type biogenesis protein